MLTRLMRSAGLAACASAVILVAARQVKHSPSQMVCALEHVSQAGAGECHLLVSLVPLEFEWAVY
jgi:hypothetical protein